LLKKSKEALGFTSEQINVLNCFLDPAKMIKIEEIPNPVDLNAPRWEETRPGQIRRVIPSGNVYKHDAIWKFFHPRHESDPEGTLWCVVQTCKYIVYIFISE